MIQAHADSRFRGNDAVNFPPFRRSDLARAERVGEPRLRRARLERLLLARMRRPARQPHDLESRPQAAVGVGKALARKSRAMRISVARRSGVRRRSMSALVAPMRRRSCISAKAES